ncbi:MAG TPA: glucosyltransferase domain-containing protein [Rudaea sp.]|nr:glucosyltransferase domain-containing protein [Rudaea sp.]
MQSTPTAISSWFRLDILALLAIFFVFYFYKMAHFSLSIDDELEATQTYSSVWALTGRWAGYLFDKYLLPQSTIPFLPVFLFGFFASVSYVVSLRAFAVRKLAPAHYAAFPIYAAFPTWIFLAAFAANIASAGIGLLFMACAAYRYRRILDVLCTHLADRPQKIPLLDIAAGGIFLAISIGIYQSFIFAFFALSLAVVLTMWLQDRATWKFLRQSAAALASITIVALVIYEIADNILRFLLNLSDRSYLGAFLDWRLMLQSPLTTALKVWRAMTDIYGGTPDFYGLHAFAFPLVLLFGVCGIASIPSLRPSARAGACVFAACILGVPFLQHFLADGFMPIRTLVAVPIVVWFFCMAGLTSTHRRIATGAALVLFVALFQILYSSTLLQTANYFVRVHDEMLATSVYNKIIEAHPDFSASRSYTVDFYGAKRFETSYPRPISSSSGWSFFEWDGGNMGRILNYMHMMGFANLNAANDSQRRADLTLFKDMPVWPAANSVKAVGDVTLIKLSDAPGWPYNTPK